MRYSKPELLSVEVALDAIRGEKPGEPVLDTDFDQTIAAYEADE